jgi:hypothetical protein
MDSRPTSIHPESKSNKPKFAASRPHGNNPSKQELPELDEFQESMDGLLDKEREVLSSKELGAEAKLTQLASLFDQFNENANLSYMMSIRLEYPLNKTFFNIFLTFQRKAIEILVKMSEIPGYRRRVSDKSIIKETNPLNQAIVRWRDDYSILLLKLKLVNEFPESKEENETFCSELETLEDEEDILWRRHDDMLKQKEISKNEKIIKLLNETAKQNTSNFRAVKAQKLKKIDTNLKYALAYSSKPTEKITTQLFSTSQIQQSLNNSTETAEIEPRPNLQPESGEDKPNNDESIKPNIKRKKSTGEIKENKKARNSYLYQEPSQILYNLTPSQEVGSQETIKQPFNS